MSHKLAESNSKAGDHAVHHRHTAHHDAGSPIAEAVADMTSHAKEIAQKGYEAVAERGKQYKENAEEYITGNPWYAIGIAAGVGFVFGALLRRRR